MIFKCLAYIPDFIIGSFVFKKWNIYENSLSFSDCYSTINDFIVLHHRLVSCEKTWPASAYRNFVGI